MLPDDAMLGLRPGERVLDVGCGGFPLPAATHLVDRFGRDGRHRFGVAIRRDGRPLAEAGVEALPFADGAFDYVFCRHVLEHVADPALACAELSRVGRRGYVECPASWLEVVAPAREHRWLVDLEEGVLIFREKRPLECLGVFDLGPYILSRATDPAFQRDWNTPQMYRLRNVILRWEGRLPCKVIHREDRGAGGR